MLSSSQPGLFYVGQAQTICLGNVFHFAFYAIFLRSLDDIPVEQLNILAISHFYAIFLCSLNNNTIGKLDILDLDPEDDEQLDRFRNAAALKVVPIVFEIRQKL